MGVYAQDTSVSVERSKAEIESLLSRYGADQFLSGWDNAGNQAMIGFRAKDRHVQFLLHLPDRNDKKYFKTPGGRKVRGPDDAYRAWERDCRQRWRALALVVKAKLEAVSSGITTFEDEFLAHIVLPNGKSVGQWLRPQLAKVYQRGEMPRLLPGPTTDKNGTTPGA